MGEQGKIQGCRSGIRDFSHTIIRAVMIYVGDKMTRRNNESPVFPDLICHWGRIYEVKREHHNAYFGNVKLYIEIAEKFTNVYLLDTVSPGEYNELIVFRFGDLDSY